MECYSRREVLRHNKENDAWLILKNKVYDVTEFLQLHPGGKKILLNRIGEDATSYFVSKHGRTPGFEKQLDQYCIGTLHIAESIPLEAFEEPFMLDLLEEVHKNKLYKIPPRKKFWADMLRVISVFVFFLLSIYALYISEIWWLSVLLIIVQAILGTSLFGWIAHEATHRNIPKGKFSKLILKYIWPIIWPFISQKPLYFEHNTHHIKIGDPDHDFEVAGFAKFLRFTGLVKYKPLYKYQHKTAILLYPFYANIITTIGGAFSKYWVIHRRNYLKTHGLSLLYSMIYYIVIPSIITGQFLWVVFLYLTYQCVMYNGIYIGAAVNHFTVKTSAKIPDEMKNKYAYYICNHTSNFNTFHPFWFWYTGGFNVQIEHHLLPFIPVENLKQLVSIVKQLCQKYKYPYVEFDSIGALLDDHYEYMRLMSSETDTPFILQEIENKKSYQPR